MYDLFEFDDVCDECASKRAHSMLSRRELSIKHAFTRLSGQKQPGQVSTHIKQYTIKKNGRLGFLKARSIIVWQPHQFYLLRKWLSVKMNGKKDILNFGAGPAKLPPEVSFYTHFVLSFDSIPSSSVQIWVDEFLSRKHLEECLPSIYLLSLSLFFFYKK